LRGRMGEINAAAQARAEEYNKRIANEEQTAFANIRDQLLSQNPLLLDSFEQSFKSLRPEDYINERTPVRTQDVYSQAEADEINAALADLGAMDPRASVGDWNKPVSVNEQALKDMVADQFRKQEAQKTAVATEPRQTSPIGALGEYISDRGEVAKDYLGKRNPFRR